ncbi:MAG: hypothetical protein ACLFTA_01135 [Candidatus Nanohaloarchaea archaeon]
MRSFEDVEQDVDFLLDAMNEVRDTGKEASEYEFLEKIEKVHPAPSKKGNDGLANWVANLAVFEAEGDIVVDKGLVEEADRILTEQHGSGRDRSRIANIVYDSENRPGHKESLADNRVDGHGRILEMVGEFYSERGRRAELENLYKDKELLRNCDNISGGNIFGTDPATGLKVAVDAAEDYLSEGAASDYTVIPVKEDGFPTQNQESNQGGENMARKPDDPEDLGRQARDMRGSQEEMYEGLLAGEQAIVDVLTDYDVAFGDAFDAVRGAESRVGDVLQQAEHDYDTVADWAEGFVDELEGYDPAVDPDEFVDRAYDRLDNELGTMSRNTDRFRDQSDFIDN